MGHAYSAAVALLAANCGQSATPTPVAPAPPALAGRARSVTFECPGADPSPRTHSMSCATRGVTLTWRDVDPPRPVPPDSPKGPPDDTAVHPCVHGIRICSVSLRAPQGSQALSCSDDDGRRHGPIEVIAPDGSLLVQGFCVHGTPSGTWFWWQAGALASTQTYPLVDGGAASYTAPDTYVYGDHRLVPLREVTP